jgi:hypothetical protein
LLSSQVVTADGNVLAARLRSFAPFATRSHILDSGRRVEQAPKRGSSAQVGIHSHVTCASPTPAF